MNKKVKFPGGKPENTDGRKKAKTYMRRFFLLPVCLLSRTPVNLGEGLFVELRRLREEKYDHKFRQRLFLLVAGNLCWLVYAWTVIMKYGI